MDNFKKVDNSFIIIFDEPRKVSHVVLKENIREGAKVKRYSIKAQPYLKSRGKIDIYQSSGIGHKAICQFPVIYIKELYIEIEEAEDYYLINNIEVYYF